eukprot:TRINITY_DN2633_c0_g1_i1.p1 TRINITY_DN2633_c0_g1~~TRINITY_DN2633_c0_g1_i1.p1  ORF type:complete len:469 (+),score=169.11 TRINITY_DN2633_c0_g1_i1:64-1470(+)
MGHKASKGERLPPEEGGLPFLGNAISFVKSPIKFIDKTSHELGMIWRTEVVGDEQVFFVGNEGIAAMLDEENATRADPIPYMVQILTGGDKRVIPFLDGEAHIKRKNLLWNLVTDEAMDAYFQVFQEILEETLPRLAEKEQFSCFDEFTTMQAKFIMRVLAGFPKDYVEQHIGDMECILRSLSAGLQSKLPIAIPFTAFGNALDDEATWLKMLEESLIEREKLMADTTNPDRPNPPMDFLTILIRENAKLDVHEQLSNAILARELIHLTIANYGVTSLLTYFVFALMAHPEERVKVEQEMNQVFPEKPVFTSENLRKMVYTESVIRETLRFYPIVPILAAKAKRDFVVEGFTIKKGWSLMGGIFNTNRDPRVYDHPNEFDPSRFSERKEDMRAKCPMAAYIPQGGGDAKISHRCLGEAFSHLIAKLYMTVILKNYDVTLIAEQNVEINFDSFSPLPFDGIIVKLLKKN